MTFNLYDAYALQYDDGSEYLVVHTDGNDIDENNEAELDAHLIDVEIDPETGDRIIRIPAETWAKLPVETAVEIEIDADALEGEDFEEDETHLTGEAFGNE
jgi:hypothetical protein